MEREYNQTERILMGLVKGFVGDSYINEDIAKVFHPHELLDEEEGRHQLQVLVGPVYVDRIVEQTRALAGEFLRFTQVFHSDDMVILGEAIGSIRTHVHFLKEDVLLGPKLEQDRTGEKIVGVIAAPQKEVDFLTLKYALFIPRWIDMLGRYIQKKREEWELEN